MNDSRSWGQCAGLEVMSGQMGWGLSGVHWTDDLYLLWNYYSKHCCQVKGEPEGNSTDLWLSGDKETLWVWEGGKRW